MTDNPTTPPADVAGAPARISVVIRAATSDDWIGIAYQKDYTGDPSAIHEYTRATPADLTERSQALYSVIVGIAKSLGWSSAWPDPKDDSRWFVERPSREEGKIEMAPLEAAITLRSANLAERAHRAALRIQAWLREDGELGNDVIGELAAIIAAEFTDASGTSAEMKSHDLSTHSEPENR